MQSAVEGVVVTGGLGALGRTVARAIALTGAPVAVVDMGAGNLPDVQVIGDVDLSHPDQARAAIDEAARRLGGLRVLINLAGGFRWQTLGGSGPDDWSALFSANLMTAVNASRAALPHIIQAEAGRIVNVGAAAALKAGPGMGPYAAAKGAVHRLTESLAAEVRGSGVTVNAVLPSIIDTPANRSDMPDAIFGDWVSNDELTAVILFLCSAQASAVNGALIPVAGRVP